MYSLPTLKTRLYPTIDETLTALRQADEDLSNIRDVRPLMAILTRMSIASPRLSGHLLTRRTALSSFKWKIVGKDEKKALEAELRLKKLINKTLNLFVNRQAFGALCFSVDWNLSDEAGQLEFIPSVKKVYKPVEIEKGEETVYILSDKANDKNKKDIRKLTSDKFIWSVDNSLWIGGALRSIVFHELLRNDTLQEWSNFNKKLKGLIQAKADNEQKADAGAALQNMVSNNYTVTSKDVEFAFNELTSSKGVESFKTFSDMIEESISIAILGQANTSVLPKSGGSRAALEVLNLIRTDIIIDDMNSVKELIENQILTEDYKLNNDKNAVSSPFTFEFIYDENADIETNARALEIIARIGLPVTEAEVYKKIDFKIPAEGEKLASFTTNSGL
jgi:hypothetical protein